MREPDCNVHLRQRETRIRDEYVVCAQHRQAQAHFPTAHTEGASAPYPLMCASSAPFFEAFIYPIGVDSKTNLMHHLDMTAL